MDALSRCSAGTLSKQWGSPDAEQRRCWRLCQNECFDATPLRCVRISKMQGIEDEGDRSLLE